MSITRLFIPLLTTSAIVLGACGGSETDVTLEGVPATGSAGPADQRLEERADRTAPTASASADLGPAITPATGYEDPVCHMTVSEDATARHTHDEVTYGFCSEACKGAFAEDPDAFLVAMEE